MPVARGGTRSWLASTTATELGWVNGRRRQCGDAGDQRVEPAQARHREPVAQVVHGARRQPASGQRAVADAQDGLGELDGRGHRAVGPDPEQRAGAAGHDRRGHAGDVAGADRGRERRGEGLERRESALSAGGAPGAACAAPRAGGEPAPAGSARSGRRRWRRAARSSRGRKAGRSRARRAATPARRARPAAPFIWSLPPPLASSTWEARHHRRRARRDTLPCGARRRGRAAHRSRGPRAAGAREARMQRREWVKTAGALAGAAAMDALRAAAGDAGRRPSSGRRRSSRRRW